jgi:hypothetical protein
MGDHHRPDFDELGTGQENLIHKANPLDSFVFWHGKAGLLASNQGRALLDDPIFSIDMRWVAKQAEQDTKPQKPRE